MSTHICLNNSHNYDYYSIMHVAQNTLYIDKYGEHTYKVTNYEILASLLIIWGSHQSETNLPVGEVLNTDMLTILILVSCTYLNHCVCNHIS